MKAVHIHHGDSREVIKGLADNSIDSVVCDPPYALVSIVKRFGGKNAAPAKSEGASGVYKRASAGFMGQAWDTGETAFDPEFWAEVLRVLKPGGHLIAASGTRTYHRLAVAIEDAGFEVRDMISWLYGSGFPKSHDVSKGIDKARNDKPDIHRVAAFVAAGRDAAGVTNKQIDALFGFNGMAGHWTNSRGPQAQVPRWDQWLKLKDFIALGDEMDAEVWRLNGRKGAPGNEREITRAAAEAYRPGDAISFDQRASSDRERRDKAVLAEAAAWQGWGTALKPACEPWVLARKPLESTVAANVLAHGTGALNIDGCRVPLLTGQRPSNVEPWENDHLHCGSCADLAARSKKHSTPGTKEYTATSPAAQTTSGEDENALPGICRTDTGCSDGMRVDNTATSLSTGASGERTSAKSQTDGKCITGTKIGATMPPATCCSCGRPITSPCIANTIAGTKNSPLAASRQGPIAPAKEGRWPSNVIHDGSEEVVEAFPWTESGEGAVKRASAAGSQGNALGRESRAAGTPMISHGDSGSTARFFYSAKADADDRLGSKHPTVKPIDLMRYLVRLVTPPGGIVLDPFAGSGSTGVAAMLEGFESILIEREAAYVEDIKRKVAFYSGEGRLAAQEKGKVKAEPVNDLPLFGGEAA